VFARDLLAKRKTTRMSKIIIIGGNAAGLSAAAKHRRIFKESEIVVYEKGGYLSYASCGLPYFVTVAGTTPDSLIEREKEQFEAEGIRPHLRHEVLAVMPQKKKVLVKNLVTGAEFEDAYDKLFISTGSYSMKPQVPGTDLAGVFTFKSIDDGIAVKNWVSRPETGEIVIIGGGYIGFEMAEALAGIGKKVRVIHRSERLLKTFDPEIAALARQELERLGVEINTNENIRAIAGDKKAEQVITDKGAYKADMVLLAVGVRPATSFLKDSGIALGKNGAIVIDRQMCTNLPDIYAAGDCAEIYHMVKKANDYIPLATTANKCGRIAGENLGGRQIEFPGTLGSAAIKVGRLELARTGLSEAEAASLGFDYKTTTITAYNKPTYYPGSYEIQLKMIYEKGTKRVLGAQGAGNSGVVLRIDAIAAAISGGLTAEQLGYQDFCYAPPFATVWDPVNILANTAK